MDVKLSTSAAQAAPMASRGATLPGGKILPASGQQPPPDKAASAAPERVEQAVQQIQTYLNDTRRQLEMQVDRSTGRTIVRVVNPETQELIRQIPSEEVLKLAAAIGSGGGQVISELA